ncbi:type II secretion system protein GspD [Verminephrobacter aporrectodeae subsp. tuberculatae]|uniref:type II secretion system secretin GspD n=2 Tax=Verminephrobacter aporrectodeae TaxID=1110389 RepID=UPI002243FB0D|nr:type II secretion system secretin GspD [Verminephrobacter aporrectodeae]MCW8164485.1 type II secretion system protein GspD [Verminephrobacter aporrectodeae subsp. tuberculatae]MCW8168761.1 type II secretion system protein GspD [Verminephrobacter aporrectodeae subsp. tuberculatae]
MKIRPSILLLSMLTAGCAGTRSVPPVPAAESAPAPAAVTKPAPQTGGNPQSGAAPADLQDQDPQRSAPVTGSLLFPGTDQLFKHDIAPRVNPVLSTGAKVSLNFENVTVASLASALLGDLLRLNYTIDAGGDTVVSLHTRQPLPRNQVLDVLDAVLLPHDLAIVRDSADMYHVTRRAVTIGARPVVGAARFRDLSGAGTVIVPLNHVAAVEMAKILGPLAPREAIVYVDTLRNLLVLQGSKAQLGGWLEMVEAFDVDFLSGMSLGVFVLENVNVNVVREALQVMFGPENLASPYAGNAGAAAGASAQVVNPLEGLIRVFPVERLNALVVVTPRSQLLTQVETWIRRLDRPTDALEAGLFVYLVQNGSAQQLADMLSSLFGGESASAKPGGGVATGSAPPQFARGVGHAFFADSVNTAGSATPGAAPLQNPDGNAPAPGSSTSVSANQLDGNVRIVADEKRNALLIRAPRTEYRRIEQALRELDKAPSQVLIEASIVEVSLTGNLQYGVEWFVKNSLSGSREGQALLNMHKSGDIGAKQPGFSYTLLNKAGIVRATLNALAEKSQVRLLSSPSVLVLNNHNATIQVGQQQPVKNSTAVTAGNLITESITYKDTGVMLSVTPSVNAGGLITMDISQQVTDVGDLDSATGQRAFLTRQIQTRVAVRSGEPIVLGGLIRENDTNGRSGVPILSSIPLLGALFANTTNNNNRTELLVLMTPRALEDDDQLRAVSAEMRQRMRSMTLDSQSLGLRTEDVPAASK